MEVGGGSASLESRPGVFVVGSPNVGKRTLLSRLLSIDIPDTNDLSRGILCQGWTIDTKYYSADLTVWTAHLAEDFYFGTLPISKQLTALVLVFDMNDESSFLALKDWVPSIDIEKFEILLCIGNKADLVPGHYAHAQYRRYLQKHGESTSDPHPEFWDYGIDETEGCSLLGDEETSLEIRKSCMEWCSQYNIEFIESCASNADFDKCLSVDGDIQGVERLYGALSAHMWPGMVLKSGNKITTLSQVEKEEFTDDDSDYEIEYEVLSRGSAEPWDDVTSASGVSSSGVPRMSREHALIINSEDVKHETVSDDGADDDEISISKITAGASTSLPNSLAAETGKAAELNGGNDAFLDQDLKHEEKTTEGQISTSEVQEKREVDAASDVALDEDSTYGYEDLEKLMCEIGSMRDNLRLMPDFQRREMAAKLAMKMAAMFGDSGDEEEL